MSGTENGVAGVSEVLGILYHDEGDLAVSLEEDTVKQEKDL